MRWSFPAYWSQEPKSCVFHITTALVGSLSRLIGRWAKLLAVSPVKPWSKRMEAMAIYFEVFVLQFPRHWSGFNIEIGYVWECRTQWLKTSSENFVSSQNWASSWGQSIAKQGRGNAVAFECLGRQGDWPCGVSMCIYGFTMFHQFHLEKHQSIAINQQFLLAFQAVPSPRWGHALLCLLWWQLQHQRGELQALGTWQWQTHGSWKQLETILALKMLKTLWLL